MKKVKALIIDDEEDFLSIVKLNLESTGNYEVLTVNHPEDAVSQTDIFKPDIILLDMIMPKVNGLEILKALKNDPKNKEVPIVIFTAVDKNAEKLQALELGAQDYLIKPLGKDDLITKIEEVLGV